MWSSRGVWVVMLAAVALGGCASALRVDAGGDAADASGDSTDASALDAMDGGGPAAFGAVCVHDTDCASGICLSSGHCTRSCTGTADCPSSRNWMCVSLPGRGPTCDCTVRAMTDTPCNGVDDDCDGTVDNSSMQCSTGCVDLASDANNCGGCGVVCGGGQVCRASHCECPAERSTVCGTRCVDTASDTANCGACGNACPTGGGATALCTAAHCSLQCATGTGDCDGNMANGCEANTRSDMANCGTCGHACSFANATGTCATGSCVLAACAANFGDCDLDPSNGCETDLRASLAHCGACGRACAPANGVGACMAGACQLAACAMGFANCNAVDSDGCEVNPQSSATNCGACGHVCPGTGAAHTTSSCAAGACSLACMPGWDDCDGNMGNGCETSTSADMANCGTCGHACVFANGAGVCSTGACVVTSCTVDHGDCDATSSNGCETDLRTSLANCGACGQGCAPANGFGACLSNACTITSCATDYANCDGIVANGCEANLSTSALNCGACGHACPGSGAPNTTANCAASACTFACASGFADCDGNMGNGCEANTNSDSRNCGACGTVCTGGRVCVTGGCTLAPLYHGWTSPIAGCLTTSYDTTAPTALGGTYPFNVGDTFACRAWKLAATVCTTQPTMYADANNWQCPNSGGFIDPVFGSYCAEANQYACSTCPGACNAGTCLYMPLSLRNCAGMETTQR